MVLVDTVTDPPLVEIGVRSTRYWDRLKMVFSARELLLTLSGRDIKSRHKQSVFGLFWNFLNPLLNLSIYSVVFSVVLPGSVPRYPLKLLAGMMMFQFFSMGVSSAATSVTTNASLVTKIWFPREVLPLAAVMSNTVTFATRMLILVIGLLVYWNSPQWSLLWLMLPAVIIVMILAAGFGMILAALNVFYRDVQYFLDLALMAMFWFTPIIYGYDHMAEAAITAGLPERVLMLNPLIPIVLVAQRTLYNPTNFDPEVQAQFSYVIDRGYMWHLGNLAIAGVMALGLVMVALKVFARLESRFAERL